MDNFICFECAKDYCNFNLKQGLKGSGQLRGLCQASVSLTQERDAGGLDERCDGGDGEKGPIGGESGSQLAGPCAELVLKDGHQVMLRKGNSCSLSTALRWEMGGSAQEGGLVFWLGTLQLSVPIKRKKAKLVRIGTTIWPSLSRRAGTGAGRVLLRTFPLRGDLEHASSARKLTVRSILFCFFKWIALPFGQCAVLCPLYRH